MGTTEPAPTVMALVYPAPMAVTALRFDLRAPACSPATSRDLCAAALEMAAWADEKGFDSLVTSEHHADADGYMPSPVTFLAGFAARTERIPIVASALLLPLYDPGKLSEDLCLLDLISDGRCRTTVGIGYRPDDVYLTTGPLYHSGPGGFMGIAYALGNTVVVQRKFDPEDWLRLTENTASPAPFRRRPRSGWSVIFPRR